MTEHEPECWCRGCTHPHVCGRCRNCICDELRACEQRVLEATREAVAALRGCIGTDDRGDGTVWVEKIDALTAIDALREKP